MVLAAGCASSHSVQVTIAPSKPVYTYPEVVQYDIHIVNSTDAAITVMEETRFLGEAGEHPAPDRRLRSLGDAARRAAATPRRIEAGDSLVLRRDVDRESVEAACSVTPLLPPGEYNTTVNVPVRSAGAAREDSYSGDCAFSVLPNRELPSAFAAFLEQCCRCQNALQNRDARAAQYAKLEALAEDVLASTSNPDVAIVLAENLLAARPVWTAGPADEKLCAVFLASGRRASNRHLVALYDLFPQERQRELYERAAAASLDPSTLALLRRRLSK
jgi:hypothetical protein